jgi:hypothetical protein
MQQVRTPALHPAGEQASRIADGSAALQLGLGGKQVCQALRLGKVDPAIAKARRVNSPGWARRRPGSAASAASTAAITARPPCRCNSARCSPVTDAGPGKNSTSPSSSRSPAASLSQARVALRAGGTLPARAPSAVAASGAGNADDGDTRGRRTARQREYRVHGAGSVVPVVRGFDDLPAEPPRKQSGWRLPRRTGKSSAPSAPLGQAAYWFIVAKKSSLVLESFILSSRNSIASTCPSASGCGAGPTSC